MIGPVVAVLLLSSATSLEVRVHGAAGTLGGTLTLPLRGRGPFPAVVTITGSGAHHRDGNRTPEHPYRPFRQIAESPMVNHHFQRDPIGAREGYDRLPTQDLVPEVLEALCSWLGATLFASSGS